MSDDPKPQLIAATPIVLPANWQPIIHWLGTIALVITTMIGMVSFAPSESGPAQTAEIVSAVRTAVQASPTLAPPVKLKADPISTPKAVTSTAAAKKSTDWKQYPKAPVPVGKFAAFAISKDITQPQWAVHARSTEIADPLVSVDSDGVEAMVETATPGTYFVEVWGIRANAGVYLATEFAVVSADDPVATADKFGPPHAPDRPPVPKPPKPKPAPAATGVQHAYFVFLDRWTDRDESPDLQALGPNADEWAAIRAAGHKVLNLDADSDEAKALYPTYLDDLPCLLTFDRDKANKFVSATPVKSLEDLRGAYKAVTGKGL